MSKRDHVRAALSGKSHTPSHKLAARVASERLYSAHINGKTSRKWK